MPGKRSPSTFAHGLDSLPRFEKVTFLIPSCPWPAAPTSSPSVGAVQMWPTPGFTEPVRAGSPVMNCSGSSSLLPIASSASGLASRGQAK